MSQKMTLMSLAAVACCARFAAAQLTFPSDCTSTESLSGASGTVDYPAGGGNYANNMRPCWHIACSAGSVELKWTRFDTEQGYDKVSVWEVGAGGVGQRVVEASGSGPAQPTVVVSQAGALVRFTSDYSVTATGFTAAWTCGETAAPPVVPPPPACTDVMVSDGNGGTMAWYDADGAQYNCQWYSSGTRCSQYGGSYSNFGHTANTACCVCGGGETEAPTPTETTTEAPTETTTTTTTTDAPGGDACGGKRVRKEWRQLTTAERGLFLRAVVTLKQRNEGTPSQSAKGGYDKYPTMHGRPSSYLQAHSTGMFLPWHRVFIQKFEDDLRSLGAEFACVTLPYWDWSIEGEMGVAWDPALWNGNTDPVTGDYLGVGSVYNGRTKELKCDEPGAGSFPNGCCVSDGPQRQGAWLHSNEASGALDGQRGDWPMEKKCVFRFFANDNLPRDMQGQIDGFMTQTGYGVDDTTPGFRTLLESREHSDIHSRVGGYMITDYSPEDIVFFMHHANVDRLWAMWQVCHGYDDASQSSQYNAGPSVGGHPTGLNDEMMFHNFFDRADGATEDPQPAQWSGYTPAKVWDLHHDDLYAFTGGPKVQYQANAFNTLLHSQHCQGRPIAGQHGWFRTD